MTKAQSDSIYILANTFIQNFKVSEFDTLKNGFMEKLKIQDSSRGIAKLGSNNRTIVAVIEQLSVPSNKPEEYKILYDYLMKLKRIPVVK